MRTSESGHCSVSLDFRPRTYGLMVLEAPLVATQLFLHTNGRLLGARIRVGRHSLSLKHDPGIKMHDAFGMEAETVLPDRHMPGIPAIEIFGRHLGDARIDLRAQRFSQVDVLTRDAKRHSRLRYAAHDSYDDIGS